MKVAILTYVLLVLLQLAGTFIFMVCHLTGVDGVSFLDWIRVLWHSIPQHMCMAGYVIALPIVLWTLIPTNTTKRINRLIVSVMVAIVSALWAIDIVLYHYWHTRLDATPFFYFLDDPVTILSQVPFWLPLQGIILSIAFAVFFYKFEKRMTNNYWLQSGRIADVQQYLISFVFSSVLCGLVFLSIRGGVGEGSMNIGRAYFSNRIELNHAAVNPAFSFFYSLGKKDDFASMYRFMSDEECREAVADLERSTRSRVKLAEGDSVKATCDTLQTSLLTTKRPNIVILVFESFSGKACNALYKEANPLIMPTFNRLYADTTAVRFRKMYCNSYRTDRGMAAIFASYPGQPTTSVMKYQNKCDNLNYWTKHLRNEGYDLQFVHGGDVTFTNTQGFMYSAGFDRIKSEEDFTHDLGMQDWGVPDHVVFDNLAESVIAQSHKSDRPFLKAMLTLSSHEPFDVPYHHLQDEYENSVAYTDSAFGAFIDRVKADTAVWNNLLIIAVPDHCYVKYPEDIALQSEHRFHVPCIWTGGAVRGCEVNTIGMQVDLGATLLSQMDIAHDDLIFSHDIMDPNSGHYAFYAWYDGFGLKADNCLYTQDNENDLQPLTGSWDPDGKVQRWGRAYLQNLMNDLAGR